MPRYGSNCSCYVSSLIGFFSQSIAESVGLFIAILRLLECVCWIILVMYDLHGLLSLSFCQCEGKLPWWRHCSSSYSGNDSQTSLRTCGIRPVSNFFTTILPRFNLSNVGEFFCSKSHMTSAQTRSLRKKQAHPRCKNR